VSLLTSPPGVYLLAWVVKPHEVRCTHSRQIFTAVLVLAYRQVCIGSDAGDIDIYDIGSSNAENANSKLLLLVWFGLVYFALFLKKS